MRCHSCGTTVPAGVGVCPRCGGVPSRAVGATSGATRGVGATARQADGDTAAGTLDVGHVPPSVVPLAPGQTFGPRYHIIRLLGLGGMGAVYQARDEELDLAVALKVIRRDLHGGTFSSEVERRFKTELLLARQVTHKNVVRIHDLGEIDGIKYITMPYIRGDDLATVLRRNGRLSLGRALPLMRQIADGLAAAHEVGVIHRDLKPPNIMIGAEDHAWIMDFGISSSAADVVTGELIGTPEYMAPEQGRGEAVDARADVYAFGLIGHEMLVGLRPLPAPQDRLEAMRRRFEQGLPALRALDPSIPASVDHVVRRCLAADPTARFQTAAEICAALDRIDDTGEIIPEPRRLTPRIIAVAGVLLVLLLAGTSIVTRRAVAPPKQHDPVSVLIADFQNQTGDSTFNRTLEPMLKRGLEDAGFISAYDRGAIRTALGVRPPDVLNDVAARELAVKQGLGIVVSGTISRQRDRYLISIKAAQTVTGAVISAAQRTASSKEQVLSAATRLVADIQTALGDESAESRQFAMASLSATSLDVVRYYAAAQEAASNGKFDEALDNASKAVQIDPKFGIGYQLMAVQSRNLGRLQDAERYVNEAVRYVDGMTERERYSTRGFFFRLTRDYKQCAKEYGELLSRYTADIVGHNGLALCASQLRDLRRARDEVGKVVAMLPNRALFRDNLALYSDYDGDFQAGEQEARKVGDTDAYALLALAFAQLGQDKLSDAQETYQRLRGLNPLGESIGTSGLGDLAAFQGHFSDAMRILQEGAAQDLAAQKPDSAAAKLVGVANAELSRGHKQQAVDAALKALKNSKAAKIRFLAARAFLDAGEMDRARELSSGLASELQQESRAYAKIIDANAALKSGDPRRAIALLNDANEMFNTWLGHFDLGRAYLDAGALIQADSEFDLCLKRRGEALALFLDEEPTYAYLPPVYYQQGRVRERLKTEGFVEAYRSYLAFRGDSTEDPLVRQLRGLAAR